MPRVNLIQVRGGTAAAWTTANPVLALREPGLETDTNKVKYGDGATVWASLPYASGIDHFRGSHDLSTEAYPATGGTGAGGIPAIGDYWYGINSGEFNVQDLGNIDLFRGALLIYIGGTVTSPASWIVKQ